LAMMKPLAQKYGVKLDSTNISDMDLKVLTDKYRLNQVLINLISNAIKYNKENGTVEIYYQLEADKVRLFVKDSGKGIQVDKQSQLFTAFDRLGHGSGSIEGTGIGLVISKKLIEAMHGSISYESQEGVGSTFWIDLPLASSLDLPINEANAGTINMTAQREENATLYRR